MTLTEAIGARRKARRRQPTLRPTCDWLLQAAIERLPFHSARVARGYRRMSESRVVLCGLARDVAGVLPRTIARLESLGERFADYQVVIYENDSVDETRATLARWAHRNPRVHVESEVLNAPVNPVARCTQRATRMAAYRNRCHDYVRKECADFDAVIVVDTDLPGGWSEDGIADTFGQPGWDFVGSNGIILKRLGMTLDVPLQYDAWAFRLDDEMSPLTTAAVNAMWWRVGEPMVPVTSCFGGVGVYRTEAFLSSRYEGWDSEHIPFHAGMRAAGYRRTFLNPSQITYYGQRKRKSDWWAMPCVRALSMCRSMLTTRENARLPPWKEPALAIEATATLTIPALTSASAATRLAPLSAR